MSNVVLGQGDPDRLIEALLGVPALAGSDERDTHVERLIVALRRPVEIDRFVDQRDDLASIVKAGLTYSGGVRVFTREVESRHPGEASSRAVAIANEFPGLLSALDRDALRRRLVGIPMEELVGAIGELGEVKELSSVVVWLDMSRVIRTMEGLPARADGIPPLLAFVSRLTRLVSAERADGLRGWLDEVAGGLGVPLTGLAELREPGGAGPEPEPPARAVEEAGRVWGDVPIRNRNFTGRAELLDQLAEKLRTSSKASVLPQTLHGMGGVGKTQLVIEYVHRHAQEYQLVWWIAAEQASTVLASLSELADRLGIPTSDDRQQTARTVLHALAGARDLRWLLVYDNADDPDALDDFLPSSGGHVILTTRNQEWANLAPAIEVDVFKRTESIELLRRRSQERVSRPPISTAEADELAEKLGDLPLALEQAIAWHLATAMPIKEYIGLLDDRISELLSEGKPAGYPLSVAAFVTLAVQQLRDIEQRRSEDGRQPAEADPATAQMFELFAYFGGDPIRVALLRYGRDADISQPLRGALGDSIRTNRMTRDLNRLGLAKLDASQRLQVHRLVQRVLRDTMSPERAAQTRENARNLLAAASPGDPDEQGEFDRQREMGPHIEPADMIHAGNLDARQAVLHHVRFLYLVGDYENSRLLADRAATAWEQDDWHERLGRDGEFTLLARAHVANATRTLGDSKAAAVLTRDTYERFQRSPLLGPSHDFTLIIGNQFCADLRIAGEYGAALRTELGSVDRHIDVFGRDHTYTLRARTNLAVDQRMIGNFVEALRLDEEIVQDWENVGGTDTRELVARMNVARDLYGLGAYQAGLTVLDAWWGELHRRLGVRDRRVLLAGRTLGVTLRKVGRHADAVRTIRENLHLTNERFGTAHEYSVAASMSLANALRELGESAEAMQLMAGVLSRYESDFGSRHPLTLVARVNKAIVHRALDDPGAARALDEPAFRDLGEVLGPDHPYTLCAGSSLATDLALHDEHEAALRLSTEVLRRSRVAAGGGHPARRGGEHPYVLMREINLAHDMRATGDEKQAEALRQEALSGLRLSLEAGHPDLVAADNGRRTEGDVEPPPT